MKFLLAFFLIWTVSYHIYAEKHFEPQKGNVFIIDNFEDGDLAINPRWWIFDKIKVSDQSNNKLEFEYLENKSLEMTGPPKNWYVGGMGTYLGIDTFKYSAIKLLVRGYGDKSGVLIIELFDDDNNNWIIEPHPKISSETLADDKFIH